LPANACRRSPRSNTADLNAGQEGAGRLLLGSHNRIVAIQGVAGAGKSTVLKPVADILREEGRAVLGLAVQNTLVQMLERDTGIPSMTVSRFLRQHSDLLEGATRLALPRRAPLCAVLSCCSTKHRWSAMPTRKSWCGWPTCSNSAALPASATASSWAQSMPGSRLM
jgi:hypothetical protein